VNLANRLQELNKQYKTSIIISQATYEKCSKYVEVRLLDFVIVTGRSEPITIYELVGEKGDISPKQKEFIRLFTLAIDSYLVRDWDRAIRLFNSLEERNPQDYPVKMYLERCQRFRLSAPEPGLAGRIRIHVEMMLLNIVNHNLILRLKACRNGIVTTDMVCNI
jgi:adenylate cyclase